MIKKIEKTVHMNNIPSIDNFLHYNLKNISHNSSKFKINILSNEWTADWEMPGAKIYFRYLGLPTNDEFCVLSTLSFFHWRQTFIKHLNMTFVVSFVLLGNSLSMMQCWKYTLKGKCLVGSMNTNVLCIKIPYLFNP